MSKEERIDSPCTRECIFNYEDNYCTGCYRELDDIWDWSKRSNDDKKEIIERAKLRRKELENFEK